MVEIRRSVHGVVVLVSCDTEEVAELVARRLGAFPVATAPADVTIELTAGGGPRRAGPPRDGRVVHEAAAGSVVFVDARDELWIDYGAGAVACCRAGAGHAWIAVDRRLPEWEWIATRPLLTFTLVELLKRRSLFAIHAAAAARGDAALLVLGPGGSGKSTTSLALLLAGWSFLGDDIVFLSRRDGRLCLLAFPDEIDVSDTTIGFFPQLGEPGEWPSLPGSAKRQLAPQAVLPGVLPAEAARPVAAALPYVVPEAASALQPLGADALLVELVPNVMITDAAATQEQLDVLAQLAREVPAFRLGLGRDLPALPALLEGLVA